VAEQPFPWSGTRVRLMNSTPAEFRRALIQAFGPAVSDAAAGLLLDLDGVQLHFALERQDSQRLGALQIEYLRVKISICAGEDAAAEKLLAKVDRATQRGGG
jgi:hypothetical protein